MKKRLVIFVSSVLVFWGTFTVFNYNQSSAQILNKKEQSTYIKTVNQQKPIIYKKFLNSLSDNNPESIIIAKDKYFQLFSLRDNQEERDIAFKAYRDFYFRTCRKIDDESPLDIYFKYSNKYSPEDYQTD